MKEEIDVCTAPEIITYNIFRKIWDEKIQANVDFGFEIVAYKGQGLLGSNTLDFVLRLRNLASAIN